MAHKSWCSPLHKKKKNRNGVFVWLCSLSTMHEAITYNSLEARMKTERTHSYEERLSSAAFTGPVIRPSGWPFAPANLCLLVYLSVYSGKEILFPSVSAAQIFILWLNLQSFSIWAKESSGIGCIDNKRANIKAQPGGRGQHWPVATEEAKWGIKIWICRGSDWWDFRQKTEYSNLENEWEGGRLEWERAKISMMGQARERDFSQEYQLQKL